MTKFEISRDTLASENTGHTFDNVKVVDNVDNIDMLNTVDNVVLNVCPQCLSSKS